MHLPDDTVAAIATAPGEGAVGIVRLSGPQALAIGSSMFDRPLRNRRAVYGRIIDSVTQVPLDEGLALLMQGPGSYTGEDIVELHGHGGVRVVQRVYEAALRAGARAAERGEFTLRAFLNSRLDLTQAEAVLDVVRARTDESLEDALKTLQGRLGGEIRAARALVLQILAYLGARADFPDDDVPLRDIGPDLAVLAETLDTLVAGAEYGVLHREGVHIAIVGSPNAGKSSLLNRLLGEERAIVTAIPGTTRDTIEEQANLLGLPVVFTDTAGIRDAGDDIERIGIQRTHVAAAQSDLILLTIDASRPLESAERTLLAAYAGQRVAIALNKCDLLPVIPPDDPAFHGLVACSVSALTGEGMKALEFAIHEIVTSGLTPPREGAALGTSRQRDAARRAAASVRDALSGFQGGAAEDLLAVDLGAAVRALGELTGEDATEDLLDTIFSRFCIGK